MGVKTTSISSNSALDVLKATQSILGTGWTIDEENIALWKDSPSAFPVGLIKATAGSSVHITPCCKDSAGNIVYENNYSAYGYVVQSSVSNIEIAVFTSPSGSIAISFKDYSNSEHTPHFGFINTNVDSSSLFIPISAKTGSYSYLFYYPGTNKTYSTNGLAIDVNGTSYVLVNVVFPYTSTVLSDFYTLASRCSDPPLVLTNGSQKFIRLYCYNPEYGGVYYMRYV